MTDFGRRVAAAAANVLPKTGQTIEYHPGDDGTYQAGWIGERFVDNGDGTITDNATSLMWPKDAADAGLDMVNRTWADQIDHIEGLEYAGHSDWRMPNILELISLVDYPFTYTQINAIFLNAQNLNLQSSTTSEIDIPFAYFWLGVYGYVDLNDKALLKKSLCVRGV